MRTDEEFGFFFLGGETSYSYGLEEMKECEYHFGVKPQLKTYQFIKWIDFEFCCDIPHMNSEMDRPSFHHNSS